MKFEHTNAMGRREVLAREVAFKRNKSGLKITEIAQQLDIGCASFAKVERTSKMLNMRTIQILVEWLGMEIQIVPKSTPNT